MPGSTSILAFYAFSPLEGDRLAALRDELHSFGAARGLRGLVLLATEGINGTACGSPEAMGEWKELLDAMFPDATWNASEADGHVFPRWLVKTREEIVSLGKPGSARLAGTHLSPAAWHAKLEEGNAVVIDARNAYETAIGMFVGAIDPKTKHFREFAAFAASCDVPKDKDVMLYCTGGIRCEKAVAAMKDAGYANVFQLEGGILSYLRAFPDGKFDGECFVFDHRVAVDRRLAPSATYALCPSCGDPAKEAATCVRCGSPFRMCAACHPAKERACSKDCAYHAARLTGARRS